MKNFFLKKINFQFLRYCFCGGVGLGVDLLIYYFLLFINTNYQIANLCGYLAGTVASFFLNRNITFEIKNRLKTRLIIFFGVACIGYLTSATLLEGLVHIIHIDPKYSKILTLPVIVLLQYYLNKKITFNQNIQ